MGPGGWCVTIPIMGVMLAGTVPGTHKGTRVPGNTVLGIMPAITGEVIALPFIAGDAAGILPITMPGWV